MKCLSIFGSVFFCFQMAFAQVSKSSPAPSPTPSPVPSPTPFVAPIIVPVGNSIELDFKDGRVASIYQAIGKVIQTKLGMKQIENTCQPDQAMAFCEMHLDVASYGQYVRWVRHPDSTKVGQVLEYKFNQSTAKIDFQKFENDGGHQSASLYARTGNGQGYLGLLSSELEGRVTSSPFGILANSSVYTGQSARMIWDLNGLLRDGAIKNVDLIVDIPDANSELSQAHSALVKNFKQVETFNKTYASFAGPKLTGHAISAALQSGLSSSAAIETSGHFLDTHQGRKDVHMTRLTAKFSQIQEVLDILAAAPATDSKSVLDYTTIMITSEFTRTRALNSSLGKDHNPQCNSVIAMGPGLKPGVYGGSRLITRAMSPMASPYLAGKPLDRSTYEVVERAENSFILRPDSVVATIVQSMGCNPSIISEGLGHVPTVKTALRA